MDNQIRSLETAFLSAANSLSYINERLELDFQSEYGSDSQINPILLTRRLSKLMTKLPKIQDQVSQIIAEKETMLKETSVELSKNTQLITKLQSCVELPHRNPTEDPVMKQFNQLVGSSSSSSITNHVTSTNKKVEVKPIIPESPAISQISHKSALPIPKASKIPKLNSSVLGIQDRYEASSSTSISATTLNTSVVSRPKTPRKSGPRLSTAKSLGRQSLAGARPVSRTTVRAPSRAFQAVSEEEFETVSNLVKKRAKLDEINEVYEKIVAHFSKSANSAPLSVADLSSMKCKVVGQTGEAKLLTLRSLGIIRMSKQGIELNN